jgi:putative transcriptional regulator
MTFSSLKGQLLISSPEIADDDFAQTVILLIEHASDGAYGLILNHPTTMPVEQAWAQHNASPCQVKGLVYFGGPCGEFLTALHTDPTPADLQPAAGLYYTQNPEKLTQLVSRPIEPIKLFAGFAGWGEGQLESELEEGAWLTMPALPEHVFSYGDELWIRLAKQILGERTLSVLKIPHRPEDPSAN